MPMRTAFLIPMSHWVGAAHEEKGKIMKTEVFIKLFSDRYTRAELKRDIASGFEMFRVFENRFSRFQETSELSRFNASAGEAVSREFFVLLKEAAWFYRETDGIFDPGVLSILENIGYRGHKSVATRGVKKEVSFKELILDETHQAARKPKNLQLDLGGIGKGYIVDLVADWLSKKYAHGIVDAGGDMRVFGGDREQNLDYFAIDVENPFNQKQNLATLILKDCAVATSGVNRRHWEYQGERHHHIIDPSRKKSAQSGLAQVTVIASRATAADVYAKTLLVLGLKQGEKFAQEKNIPACFVTENGRIIKNDFFEPYVWKT